jgi:hypothetical protein
MGQEILYCHKCGNRLVGDDFTRGRAHTFNHRQYCSACLPQQHSGALPASPEKREAKPRPPTVRRPEPAPKKANPLVFVAGGFLVIGIGIAVVVATRSPDPPPEPVAPRPVPVAKPAGPSKEKIAKDLQELEGKIQKLTEIEQFGAATDLLDEARKRYTVPEWEQPIASKTKGIRDQVATLYGPLKERATAAQLRAAIAEAQKERARVATWGRKDLLEELDKALAAVVPREALPPGAKVLVRFPEGDPSKYRFTGDLKNGSLCGLPSFGEARMIGIESGREIFKVPEEGEIRMTYFTNSPKLMNVILRVLGPDGKSYPHNYFVQSPETGKPAVLKFPIRQMKSWANVDIQPGAVCDNLYIRQDDKDADLRIHEFVILQTKP